MAQDVIINTVEYEGVDQVVLPTRDGGEANFIEAGIIPHPSDANPLMDGSASAGSSNDYSRADHVHPSDNTKANASSVYTKTEVDTALSTKADASNVYTKTEMDTALSGKADSSAVYTKTETDTLLSAKASASDLEELEQMYLDSLIHTTASGSIASFSDGFKDAPMDYCTASIEPKQEGSGDPSPTNVRPISGWTGAEVVRCGKNLFPPIVEGTFRGITATVNDDGSVTLNGTANGSASFRPSAKFVLKAGRYILSGNTDYPNTAMFLNGISGSTDIGNGTTITLTEDTEIDPVVQVYSGKTVNTTIYPMLRLASEDSTFEPYTADTYSVTWESEAGTVYGGHDELVSGELTDTRGYVDLGTLTWTAQTNLNRFFAPKPSDLGGEKLNTNYYKNVICSMYAMSTSTSNFTFFVLDGGIYIYDDRYTTASDFKTAMSGVQLVYELAQPITYQLTPQDITTLLGSNNVWSDTGAMACGYVANTKLYIDSRIS